MIPQVGENIRELHADLCSHWHIGKNKRPCSYLTEYFIPFCESSGFKVQPTRPPPSWRSGFIPTIILSVQSVRVSQIKTCLRGDWSLPGVTDTSLRPPMRQWMNPRSHSKSRESGITFNLGYIWRIRVPHCVHEPTVTHEVASRSGKPACSTPAAIVHDALTTYCDEELTSVVLRHQGDGVHDGSPSMGSLDGSW